MEKHSSEDSLPGTCLLFEPRSLTTVITIEAEVSPRSIPSEFDHIVSNNSTKLQTISGSQT
jgi:hypothetical protein